MGLRVGGSVAALRSALPGASRHSSASSTSGQMASRSTSASSLGAGAGLRHTAARPSCNHTRKHPTGLQKRARRSAAADWQHTTVAHGAARALGSAAVRALGRRLRAPVPPWAAGTARERRRSRGRCRGWAGAALADCRRQRQLPARRACMPAPAAGASGARDDAGTTRAASAPRAR